VPDAVCLLRGRDGQEAAALLRAADIERAKLAELSSLYKVHVSEAQVTIGLLPPPYQNWFSSFQLDPLLSHLHFIIFSTSCPLRMSHYTISIKARADAAEATLRAQRRVQVRLEKDLAAATSKSIPQGDPERRIRDLEDKLALQVLNEHYAM
jgi:hypothetical protein